MYILQSEKTGKFYIGSTGNLEDRLLRHNSGRSKSTKADLPWKLLYTETFLSRSEAMRRESEIKRWKSHEKIVRLVHPD
ncbi:MAG: GIY-YIG nuclease family protein [Petrimonas sp.]|nr:GIY-YIG nuclease family protein [Petrimonas sp.]